ncbi:protein phosphatase 1 regulatory subunit 15B [Engraulis encrasicolus]|uniref:protein phosphatase 1 regulatory subunit 15B n=1 Tax=Engraulis encrasicolus TaxID=184585 RepID=UPI002FD46FD4
MEVETGKQNMDRGAVNRFGDSGMMILPWTKQILFVLWEQLRFLVQLIYYSFVSVFQMFRVEVHVRISDETGPGIQHMSAPGNSAEGFFLSSLFDNNKSVLVSSSSPLSDLSGSHHPGSLLSSLVSDELCCSLVDDFVARATEGFSDTEELSIGHHASWSLGRPGEWNVFVGPEKTSGIGGDDLYCSKPSHEDKVFGWDNDTSVEADIVTASYDPFSPLSFSTSIFGYSAGEGAEQTKTTSWGFKVETLPAVEEDHTDTAALLCPSFAGRSDSESSWGSSDCSSSGSDGADGDREDSEKLWELFSSSSDPYHPLHFTACSLSSKASEKNSKRKHTTPPVPLPKPDTTALPESPKVPEPQSSVTDTDSSTGPSSSLSEEDEEEALWQSLSHSDDPYHPLHFKACLSSCSPKAKAKASTHTKTNAKPKLTDGSSSTWIPADGGEPQAGFIPSAFQYEGRRRSKRPHSRLLRRTLPRHHCCTPVGPGPDKPALVPWKRKAKGEEVRGDLGDQPAVKKVQFSPKVQVHKMWAWSFALQASRKGHWEELARDRDRFRRRVRETEQAIGYCLAPAHRDRVLTACQSPTETGNGRGSWW